MPPYFFDPMRISVEILYTVLVMFFCFAIYLKTQDLYRLSKHKGIKYFREAFLLFGLAFMIKFFSILINFSLITVRGFPKVWLALAILLLLGYISTLAILFVLRNTLLANIPEKYLIWVNHGIALALTIVALLTSSYALLMGLQFIVLVVAIILTFVHKKHKKKFTGARLFYFVIAIMWLINLLLILPGRLLPVQIHILLEIISLAIFIYMYRKVSKWAT